MKLTLTIGGRTFVLKVPEHLDAVEIEFPGSTFRPTAPSYQVMVVPDSEALSLQTLRRRYAELGFSGDCIVLVGPKHARALDASRLSPMGPLLSFIHVSEYGKAGLLHPNELGAAERFRFAPMS